MQANSTTRSPASTYGRVARDGYPTRFEYLADALHRWFDVYAFRVGESRLHQVAILFRDIAERVEARLELEAIVRSKDEFVAVLAHELRSPLAPIRNAITLLRLAQHEPSPTCC